MFNLPLGFAAWLAKNVPYAPQNYEIILKYHSSRPEFKGI